MSKVKEQIDSRFLHAEDLIHDGEWKQYTLTIDKVIMPGELTYENKQVCESYVLCFVNPVTKAEKMLAISAKCNQRLMPYATGSAKPDKWPGRKITLYAARGNWFGEAGIAAIRIRPQPGAHPKLSPKDLGVDLTGTRVVAVE